MIDPNKARTIVCVCVAALYLSGALHIAFGSLLIEVGIYVQENARVLRRFFYFYGNTLPVSCFAIIVGIIVFITGGISLFAFTQKKLLGQTFEFVLWHCGWINVVLSFAVAFVSVWQSYRWTKGVAVFQINIDDLYSTIVNCYIVALADGIVTFALAFPGACVVMHLINLRYIQSEKRQLVDIVLFEVEQEQREISKATQQRQIVQKCDIQPEVQLQRQPPKVQQRSQ